MAWAVVGILLILVKFASSTVCPRCSIYDNLIESFNDTAVTDFVLAEFGSISKLLDCVVMCSRDIRCRSYRHNVLTEMCSTYGAGYSLPEKTLNTVTAEAGSRLYAMCGKEHAYGSSCLMPGECDYVNGFCDKGVCDCREEGTYAVEMGECSALVAQMVAMPLFQNPLVIGG